MNKSKRLEFHSILVSLLGSSNVYFQPPSTIKMNYPCIVYQRNNVSKNNADDLLYTYSQGYTVTVIDPNPDSHIPEKVLKLPFSSYQRNFTSDNLNHDVFDVYY